MADEQPPPKRNVNELFTLGASEPIPEPDGSLADLMTSSPVTDLSDGSVASDPDVGSRQSVFDVPVEGEVDLTQQFTTTIEVLPTAVPEDPVGGTVDPKPPNSSPSPEGTIPSERPRTFDIGRDLHFSTEAERHVPGAWTLPQEDPPYPAALVPNAVPTPVAPNSSVRVPGQRRRQRYVPAALLDVMERRWFWGSVSAAAGFVMLGLMAGNLLPNPLADRRADVVAGEGSVPAAPSTSAESQPPADDTSSSTGAGSLALDPDAVTTTIAPESSTSSTATSSRRPVTTTRPVVRQTTTARPTSTTRPESSTSLTSSTTVVSTTTSTTAVSSTTATTTTSSSSTTDGSSTTDTTEGETTTTTAETTTTPPTSDTTPSDTTG